MERGLYTVSFDQQTIAAASGDYDLFEIVPAANRPIEIVALSLGNKSEVGDAQDEMLAYAVVRGNTTSGSGGATPIPATLNSADPAASFTAESVNSTPAATAGTTIISDTFNVRAGLMLVLPDLMRPRCNSGDSRICVRLTTAVADDLTLSGTLWVREL